MPVQKLSNEIYSLRSKSGVTQEALARAVGVTRQTIIAIEKGDYTPSVTLAIKLARFFKEPVEKIFMYHEK
jgi:putative transcriptional regulator